MPVRVWNSKAGSGLSLDNYLTHSLCHKSLGSRFASMSIGAMENNHDLSYLAFCLVNHISICSLLNLYSHIRSLKLYFDCEYNLMTQWRLKLLVSYCDAKPM